MLESKIKEEPEKKEKIINESIEKCKTKYCNKNCIETIFEDGDPNELSLSFIKKNKDNKESLNMALYLRKDIFRKKKSVLNNNFYNKITMNNIEKLKKKVHYLVVH